MRGANISRHTMLLLLIVMRTVTAGLETDDRPSEVEKEFAHTLPGSSFLHDEASFESGAGDRIVSLLSKLLSSHKEHSHEDIRVPSVFPAITALLDAVYSTEDALNRLRLRQDAEDERWSGTEDGRSSPASDILDIVRNTTDALLISLQYAGIMLLNPKGHPVPDRNDQIQPRLSLNSNSQNKHRFGLTGKGQVEFEDKMHNKRLFDSLANNIIGKREVFSVDMPYKKRPFDSLANNLIGKRGVLSVDMPYKKRPFDSIANNLIGKRGVFSVDMPYTKRPFDSLANNLIGKRGVFSVDLPYKRRPFDSLANNLIGKRGVFSVDMPYKKRPFDSLANNLIGKRGVFSIDMPYKKRPFDPLAGGLIGKREATSPFTKLLLKRPSDSLAKGMTGTQSGQFTSSPHN